MRGKQVSVKEERKIVTMGQRIGKWCIFLLICLLISSCPNGSDAEKISLPPGMGAFTLRLADSAGRTIMPVSPKLEDFAVFYLEFKPTGTTSADAEVNVERTITGAATTLTPVILAVGTYDLTVSAYNTARTAANLVAQEETSITIKPGEDNAETVKLKPLLEGNNYNNGKFKWIVTIDTTATDVESATMTIKNSAGQTQGDVENLSLTGASTGDRSLAPGIYTVVFNLAGKEGTDKDKVLEWNELMYVYATLTNDFTYTFTEGHFSRTHWNITFDYDSNANAGDTYGDTYHDKPTTTAKMSRVHGDNINNPTTLPDPVKRGYRFDGWFTDAACTTTAKWNLNAPIHNDLDLWAGWTPNQYILTLSFDAITDPMAGESFPTTPITISRGKAEPKTFTVAFTPGSYDSVSWVIKGEGTYSDISGATSPITLNGATDNYNTLGGHVIKLTVVKDGKTYIKNIPFTVVE